MVKKKIFAGLLAIILLINMFLLAFRIIGFTIFWIVVVIGAFFAYWVLPRSKD